MTRETMVEMAKKGTLPADWKRVSCASGVTPGTVEYMKPDPSEDQGDGFDSDGWPVGCGGFVVYETYPIQGWSWDLDGHLPNSRPVVVPKHLHHLLE